MLEAGSAKIDITPWKPCHLSGYAARIQPSTGVHDAIYARAVVLSDDASSAALVSCDLLGFEVGFSDSLRRRIVAETPAQHCILACTHTHGAPAPMALIDCGDVDLEWLDWIDGRIVQCVQDAFRALVPCSAVCAHGSADVAMNRRARIGGRTALLSTVDEQPKDVPRGPMDRTLAVVSLRAHDGSGICTLVNYACHAVCLGHDNRLITADYPGALTAALSNEPALGMPVFLQGACGDINPAVTHRGFDSAQWVGAELAEQTRRALEAATPAGDGPIAFAERRLTLPLSNSAGSVEAPVCALTCGSFAIASMPGEVFVELGMAVRTRSPFSTTLVVGYANGDIGYVPTRSAYPEGGYEVEDAHRYYGRPAPLAPEAGEIMVDACVECLNECWRKTR
ncbi:MAG: neutral/alkaline non-lysosomal ceramidase N-terminal domain-containing protein [Armatimonadota bacterium]